MRCHNGVVLAARSYCLSQLADNGLKQGLRRSQAPKRHTLRAAQHACHILASMAFEMDGRITTAHREIFGVDLDLRIFKRWGCLTKIVNGNLQFDTSIQPPSVTATTPALAVPATPATTAP